ncbi:MAG: histidine--tRNA ligase [Flavobacteriaceae bacterium]|jgi:histidyl-tRNA synthetase|nr:histidine--tRNA ligase [Flavobacteriaceae bacterium]MBT6449008.1 histidine--tRNA ligase [Flavobacteriaceae bacterium]MDG1831454.1 histidine--tRNA ligase [Flavobacteriaceae bacterium]
MSKTPSNPKGTRDFLPSNLSKRNYILDVIKKNFLLFGFLEIETPALEKNSTLLGKYGNEGDRLIFKILNSGEKVKKANISAFQANNLSEFTNSISEKGLRYDLTVPLARFVAQHQNDLIFPFKRFQIQNVWRADRPQHGRFQEFTQCDADIIGTNSILQEIELIKLYDTIFSELGFNDIIFKINHRGILNALANYIGIVDKLTDFISIIDKIDKIGLNKVIDELNEIIDRSSVSKLTSLLGKEKISIKKLKILFKESIEGVKGIEEINTIMEFICENNCINNEIEFDLTLARGLNYYTGTIIEVTSKSNNAIGSLGGGGRYDDLTSFFNLKNMSGVGISFGLDRIFLQMEEQKMFPEHLDNNFDIIVINFGISYIKKLYPLIDSLRKEGKKIDIYPDEVKLNKQFSYANKHNVNYAIIMGENEFKKNQVVIKNMIDGSQSNYSIEEVNSLLF